MPTSTYAHKKQQLYLVLSGIFLVNALLAEIIGVKIFSVEKTFGLTGSLSAGVLVWPVVFIGTDVINEYFGRKGVLRITFLTVGLILYAFLVILGTTKLVPADFWLDLNKTDGQGRPFNIEFAYQSIFRQGLGIIVGSLTAFVIGQVLDASVFQAFRRITGSRFIWLRATGSTLISQLVDSFVVLYVAFYLFGNWPLAQVLSVATFNYWYKVAAAVLLTPLLYLAHYLIDRYLGPAETTELQEEALVDKSV
ncbi:queuosine precursor transporter [Hymenobacter setariae]|uniref:Probable queuosine precursor transporter n=1 Tax=Hymenobacter setariae TaxID=2594794 RepID=A0A558C3Z7_9BACT|nr:queuosine precursor transporter [Hymenobacter setariae]TVT43513.1 queuosine precursor transporter [Hymenobacter setariae]